MRKKKIMAGGSEQAYVDSLFEGPTMAQVDAAWLLRVSRQRVGQLIEAGKLDAIEAKNVRVVDTRSLLNYMLRTRKRLLERVAEMRLPSEING